LEKMKIRLLMDLGTVEGQSGCRRGDILDVSEASGKRYCKYGYAEPYGGKSSPKVERAVAPTHHETATSEVPADKPKPLDEDEDDKPRPAPRRR
jgi:hypothetical protein